MERFTNLRAESVASCGTGARDGFHIVMRKPKAPKVADGPKTKTVPDEQRDYYYEGPEPVTWIHIAGTVHQFEFSRRMRRVTVGRDAACDIVVPSEYMSRHHCTLERTPGGIRVYDASKNGTGHEGRRIEESEDIRAGQTFSAGGGITFLALSDEMHHLYPLLSELLGWETETSLAPPPPSEPTPGYVIQLASGVDHLMIHGDRGCDQERLALAIHSISPVRRRDPVIVRSIPDERAAQKDLLSRASQTSLVLQIEDDMPVMDETFRSALFSPTYRIRVIAISSPARARTVLGQDHSYMRCIDLRPIAYRSAQLDRLLDRQLEGRQSPLRFGQLSEANRNALRRYSWKENFDELRKGAAFLDAYARTHSLEKAAELLGDNKWNLQYWMSDKVGLTLKPFTH